MDANIGNLKEEAELLQARFRQKTKISTLARITLAAATSHIWEERNAKGVSIQEAEQGSSFQKSL